MHNENFDIRRVPDEILNAEYKRREAIRTADERVKQEARRILAVEKHQRDLDMPLVGRDLNELTREGRSTRKSIEELLELYDELFTEDFLEHQPHIDFAEIIKQLTTQSSLMEISRFRTYGIDYRVDPELNTKSIWLPTDRDIRPGILQGKLSLNLHIPSSVLNHDLTVRYEHPATELTYTRLQSRSRANANKAAVRLREVAAYLGR